jgi:GNAT superfamily N-acetyltransferase
MKDEIMNCKTIIGEGRIAELQKTLGAKIWPEFMQHDERVNKYWPNLYTDFLNFQFALLADDEIVGIGNTVPLSWQKSFAELPDSGLDWAMKKANTDFKRGANSNLLVGIQIIISEKYQGHGISFEMLKIMKAIAKTNGIDDIALPVRPTLKSNYPLIPIADYINWQNKDGLPFDPWLRVHIKAGGKIVGICKRSMDISDSVSEWEKWTGLIFPASGAYIIDKALVPVNIDKRNDIGRYIEPNVWVIHKIK